jgi:hypothetical protein
VLAILGAFTVAIGILAVFALRWEADWRSFTMAEHATWPKSTTFARLTTRSPSGTFVTRTAKNSGDGLSSHSEKHDCIIVAQASCPNDGIEFTAQDRAMCQDFWWACRESDGALRHERFGLTLRWIDESHIEASWTELSGLDASGHRLWGRKSETYRVSVVRRAPSGAANPCDRSEMQVEALGSR